MFDTILKIIIALLVLNVLVIVHELGHYSAARIFKVTVKEFAIGLGPVIFKKKGKHNDFTLRAFPIGGFVSMEGEDEDSQDPNAFFRKAVWKRIIIILAGAVLNFVLGLGLITGLVLSEDRLPSTTVGEFFEENSSGQSGLMIDDKIVKINGSKVVVFDDIQNILAMNDKETVDVTVIRDGKKILINDVKFPMGKQGKVNFLYRDFYVFPEAKTVGNVIKHSYFRTISTGKMIYTTLYDMVRGKYGVQEMSGPVGTVKVIGEAAFMDLYTLVFLCAFITINLGVFNLLPLPALDGGRIMFLLIELVRKKPVPVKYESVIHFIGFALLILLIIAVTFNDIKNLISPPKEAVIRMLKQWAV